MIGGDLLKKIFKTGFLFILCVFLLVGCSFDISGINNVVDAVKPTALTGTLKSNAFLPADGFTATKLDFENISFTNTKNAKIYIVPSEETRVEATYPSDMEDYGFRVYFKEGKIEISVPKQTNFSVEKFEVTIFANIEEIEISGGIEIEMNAEASRKIDFDIKGGASLYVYNIAADHVEIDVAGAASMDLAGKIHRSSARNINIRFRRSNVININIRAAGYIKVDFPGFCRIHFEFDAAGNFDFLNVRKNCYLEFFRRKIGLFRGGNFDFSFADPDSETVVFNIGRIGRFDPCFIGRNDADFSFLRIHKADFFKIQLACRNSVFRNDCIGFKISGKRYRIYETGNAVYSAYIKRAAGKQKSA